MAQHSESARTAVISTTELLEAIFVEVADVRDLTRCLRVSHHWRAVVTASKSLQTALFLEPEPPTMWLERMLDPSHKPIYKIHTTRPVDDSRYAPVARSHPAFGFDIYSLPFDIFSIRCSWNAISSVDDRMLITQPPCRRIELIFPDPRPHGRYSITYTGHEPVTTRVLKDLIRELTGQMTPEGPDQHFLFWGRGLVLDGSPYVKHALASSDGMIRA